MNNSNNAQKTDVEIIHVKVDDCVALLHDMHWGDKNMEQSCCFWRKQKKKRNRAEVSM